MPERIDWSYNIEVSGGLKISDSNSITVEAYDKIEVVVEVKKNPTEVAIQPSDKVGQVQFLLIRSNIYDPKLLTYSVNKGETEEKKLFKLDKPLLLVGEGGVGLLDKVNAPTKLFFYNTLGGKKDAEITILVGRNAINK